MLKSLNEFIGKNIVLGFSDRCPLSLCKYGYLLIMCFKDGVNTDVLLRCVAIYYIELNDVTRFR